MTIQQIIDRIKRFFSRKTPSAHTKAPDANSVAPKRVKGRHISKTQVFQQRMYKHIRNHNAKVRAGKNQGWKLPAGAGIYKVSGDTPALHGVNWAECPMFIARSAESANRKMVAWAKARYLEAIQNEYAVDLEASQQY